MKQDNGEKGELTKLECWLIVRWLHVFEQQMSEGGKEDSLQVRQFADNGAESFRLLESI